MQRINNRQKQSCSAESSIWQYRMTVMNFILCAEILAQWLNKSRLAQQQPVVLHSRQVPTIPLKEHHSEISGAVALKDSQLLVHSQEIMVSLLRSLQGRGKHYMEHINVSLWYRDWGPIEEWNSALGRGANHGHCEKKGKKGLGPEMFTNLRLSRKSKLCWV